MPILDIPYTLLKYKDVYTVENEDVIPITYTLSKVYCDKITEVSTGNISVGATITLPFGKIDGKYQLDISNTNGEIYPIYIYYYNNLLLNIISNTEEVLCGCGKCKECKEDDDCDLNLNTLTIMLDYYYANNPTYNDQLSTITDSLVCSFDQKISDYLVKRCIRGVEDSKRSFLQLIAIYYIAFYTVDLEEAIDTTEIDYIRSKYKYSKILQCMKDKGISLVEGSTPSPLSKKVYYWQLDTMSETMEDVIAAFDLAYLYAKPNEEFTVFNVGKTINYFNIALIAFAIKTSDPVPYIINDVMNNDITDEFDTHYFYDTKTLLYVSKAPYSFSSMNFKIINT